MLAARATCLIALLTTKESEFSAKPNNSGITVSKSSVLLDGLTSFLISSLPAINCIACLASSVVSSFKKFMDSIRGLPANLPSRILKSAIG